MTGWLRVLFLVGMLEMLVIAVAYVAWGNWRRSGQTGIFLLMLGGTLAWLMTLSVIRWWVHVPPVLWLPGVAALDVTLALWLRLMLRRGALIGLRPRAEEDKK